ncbi:MAG: hydratase [Bacillota bacterium]|nr:hydratase [Bacillota bacterium]
MQLIKQGAFLLDNSRVVTTEEARSLPKAPALSPEEGKKGTIAWNILHSHSKAGEGKALKVAFDSLTSHDITYVGIIQTARASGLKQFPLPYVLTNCHNSLCAVGGTINEDDHAFALSAAKKYGGIFVPANIAVIHNYNREMMTGCGRMILGSDSHTRYGALGTMGVGEGGGELVKQLLGRTWDTDMPEVVGIYLKGAPQHGVGPQDVALALCEAVFADGFVKNRVLEFVGEGVYNLSIEYRNGIDVMTTETACLSSIWLTDEKVHDYYRVHGREGDYKELKPASVAWYDRMIVIDLSEIRPMIALPFHPSNAMTIKEFKANAKDVLNQIQNEARQQFGDSLKFNLIEKVSADGFRVDQGIIAGCSGGTYENLSVAANILKGGSVGNDAFAMSAYPGSQPINLALMRSGALESLMAAGVILRESFCGPCFGAGDTPSNGAFSIRHTTRNFPNREGSKPGEGQISFVALMDARSIAATARNGGLLTGADEIDYDDAFPAFTFDGSIYEKRVYSAKAPDPSQELVMGPNIKDWPDIPKLKDHLLVKIVSSITDPVTTTDELIPSGETSSYRSNPLRLAEFTLSRRDPGYVGRAKEVNGQRLRLEQGGLPEELSGVLQELSQAAGLPGKADEITYGSAVYARKPGDGSAREQAASSQRVLGGAANFANEYATKRYRSNLLNWGMMPFEVQEDLPLNAYVLIPGIKNALVEDSVKTLKGYVAADGQIREVSLSLGNLTQEERKILIAGCLINHYRDA